MAASVEGGGGEVGTRVDFSRALTFFFEDPNWIPKLIVGSLFAVLAPILVGAVFMVGYAVVLAGRTMRGDRPELPEWDELPSIFVEGLKAMAITVVHKIPLFLFGGVLLFILLGVALVRSQGGSMPEDLALYAAPALLGGWALVILLSVALAVYLPAAYVGFVRANRVGAAFDVVDNVRFMRDHLLDYGVGLVAVVVSSVVASLGTWVFCVGVFPASFWAVCVAGHVVGELARLEGPTSDVDS